MPQHHNADCAQTTVAQARKNAEFFATWSVECADPDDDATCTTGDGFKLCPDDTICERVGVCGTPCDLNSAPEVAC